MGFFCLFLFGKARKCDVHGNGIRSWGSHSPMNVLEMYSDTWLPERLISDRWDSSLFSILLNCGRMRAETRVSDLSEFLIILQFSVETMQTLACGCVGGTGWFWFAHLVGGHFANRAVCLDGLQLVQAPVQLLQRVQSELLVLLVGQRRPGTDAHAAHRRPPEGTTVLLDLPETADQVSNQLLTLCILNCNFYGIKVALSLSPFY